MVSNITCAKRFRADNLFLTEVSGTLNPFLVLLHTLHLSTFTIFFATFHHHLTFKPHECIEFLVEMVFPLREGIKLNISLSGILSINIIIVYHCFSLNFIIFTSLSLTSTNVQHLQPDVFVLLQLVAFFYGK